MNNSFDAYMDCVKAAIKAVIEPFKRFLDVFSSPLISFMFVLFLRQCLRFVSSDTETVSKQR